MSESDFSRTIHWDDPALKIFVPVQGEIPGDDGSTQVYESYENMSLQEFSDFKRARLDTAEGDIIRQWGALIDDSQIPKDVTKCANPRAALISPNEAEASHGHALPRAGPTPVLFVPVASRSSGAEKYTLPATTLRTSFFGQKSHMGLRK